MKNMEENWEAIAGGRFVGRRISSGERTRTLGDAVRVIPDECYDNPTWKGLAWLVRVGWFEVLHAFPPDRYKRR